jgi:hypothetical protein
MPMSDIIGSLFRPRFIFLFAVRVQLLSSPFRYVSLTVASLPNCPYLINVNTTILCELYNVHIHVQLYSCAV